MRLRAHYAFPLVCLLLLRRCWRRSQVRPRYPHVSGRRHQGRQADAGAAHAVVRRTAGDAVARSDPSSEVSVFGAIWVKAPISRYVAAVRDIEQFEKGENFRVTKKMSTPPRLEDFSQLKLPPDDLADLKTCKVGDCELKVSENGLNQLRKEVDWSKPTATADVERLSGD